MFGSVVAWMFKYVAGLRPDKNVPGFRNIIIQPYLFSEIDYVKASNESVRGHIGIRWERCGSNIIITLEIPCKCNADVFLPVKELDRITENEIYIFNNGNLIEGLEGISGFSIEEDGVTISVKSGQYRFVI